MVTLLLHASCRRLEEEGARERRGFAHTKGDVTAARRVVLIAGLQSNMAVLGTQRQHCRCHRAYSFIWSDAAPAQFAAWHKACLPEFAELHRSQLQT